MLICPDEPQQMRRRCKQYKYMKDLMRAAPDVKFARLEAFGNPCLKNMVRQ